MSDFVTFTKKRSAVSLSETEEPAEEIVLRGNGNAKKHLVGRDTDLCTWVLTHQTASRRHAVITVRQDKRCVTLRDNKSSFGVYLNKKKLPPDVTVNVKKRDTVSFGKAPESWVLSDVHFLSEAELVGIDEAGIRAYLYVLGLRETREIMRPDDFVPLSSLLEMHAGALSNYRYEHIKYLNAARLDPQQRLEAERDPDSPADLLLRARHTHVPKADESLPVRLLTPADLELIEADTAAAATAAAAAAASAAGSSSLAAAAPGGGGTVVHATYFQHLNRIRDVGLSRGTTKAFIHFFRRAPAPGTRLPGHTKPPNVLVFVDVRAAAAAGIKFYESTGDTKQDEQLVLSPGNLDGFIPAHLLHHIVHATTNSTIVSFEEVQGMRRAWAAAEAKRKEAEARAAAKKAEEEARRLRDLEERERLAALQAQRLSAAAGSDFFDPDTAAGGDGGGEGGGGGSKGGKKANIYLTGETASGDGDAGGGAAAGDNPFEAAAAAKKKEGKEAGGKKKLKPVGGNRRKRLCL